MTNPIIRIFDIEAQETLDREMTNSEFSAYKADNERQAQEKVEAEAKAQAKSELLDRLGITADEAKLLLS